MACGFYLFDSNKSVGMLVCEARLVVLLLQFLSVLHDCSAHHIVLFVPFSEFVRLNFIDRFAKRWCTGHITHGEMRESARCALIRFVELGPGFLEDNNPQFVAIGSREARPTIFTRNVVVHVDLVAHAVLVHPDGPDALIIHLVRNEHLQDTVLVLSHHRECGKEVAIADLTLFDVTRSYLSSLVVALVHFEDLQLAFIVIEFCNFMSANPFD